ncbi:MAG: DUF5683 domain-containing protein [Bacteroidaceae bacterium]|nr:DUF5683 domain-containing protein [Bacteroidaceae bacterium]
MTALLSFGVCPAQTDTVSISGLLPPSLLEPDSVVMFADSLTADIRGLITPAVPEIEEEKVDMRKLTVKQRDSLIMARTEIRHSSDWTPVPRRAVLLSMIIPGGGQIYNRKFWKLPVFYGGYLGCIYALTWNNQTYQDYMQAYLDIMDDDPETKSYVDFLPSYYDVESNREWLSNVLKNRKDIYRRYRDISIFCFAGVYLLSIIDAYVDAELSHFDVSRDLSLHVNPGLLDTRTASLGINFSLTF